MSLAPGLRLGPYEIVSAIGAGGMGEVYRAKDTRLGRDVALKVLPADVARDPDRRTRFEREARAVAALSHPNILAIHDIGTAVDTLFVVTELLDGETLADRLRQGALPVRKATEIAIAVARGLSAAHGKGIAHRDLKPANIFLLADGQVKILDFGLAREMSATSGATETQAALTDPGTILGTAGYMAPEQIRGHQVDGRADLFALGIVLYEMLTGTRAFARETTAETLTAILKEDPPELTATRADLPPALDRIVRHALEKNPAERFQSARDVIFALDALSGSSSAPISTSGMTHRGRLWAAKARWATLGAIAAAAVAALLWRMGPPAVTSQPIFLAVAPPHLKFNKEPHPVISPDGKRVAFWAPDIDGRSAVWVRELSEDKASAIAGSHLAGDQGHGRIDFGADSRTLFFTSNAKVRRAVVGGSAEEIGDAWYSQGFTQAADGTVLSSLTFRGDLQIVTPGSRAPQPVSMRADDGTDLLPTYPRFLPDGRHFLFTSVSRLQVFLGDLQTRRANLLIDTASPAEFANGHILYGAGGLLMAQPFDLSTLRLTGEPRPIASGVGLNGANIFEWSFSASAIGHLVYWEGNATPRSEPVWFSREGRRQGAAGAAGHYLGLAFAPRTRRVALETLITGSRVNQMAFLVGAADGGGAPIRIAQDATVWTSGPVWTPDETRLWATGFPGAFMLSPSGGATQKVFDGLGYVQDSSPDGSLVAIEWDRRGETGYDLTIVDTRGSGPPTPFRQTPFWESELRIAPSGRWAAWVANDTGTHEIYISSFPTPGAITRVSQSGGRQPMWRSDGRELFFLSAANELMAAGVQADGAVLKVSPPRALFVAPVSNGYFNRRQYAPSADGQRFLFNARIEDSIPRTFKVILNWPALLNR